MLSDGNPEALVVAGRALGEKHAGGEMLCVVTDVRQEKEMQALQRYCKVPPSSSAAPIGLKD